MNYTLTIPVDKTQCAIAAIKALTCLSFPPESELFRACDPTWLRRHEKIIAEFEKRRNK